MSKLKAKSEQSNVRNVNYNPDESEPSEDEADSDEDLGEGDAITKALRMKVLEKKGKLNFKIADRLMEESKFETTFYKGHKKTITALDVSYDNKFVMTASKDCCLI